MDRHEACNDCRGFGFEDAWYTAAAVNLYLDFVPSECDDIIRRAAVSINRSSRLPSRENGVPISVLEQILGETNGLIYVPTAFHCICWNGDRWAGGRRQPRIMRRGLVLGNRKTRHGSIQGRKYMILYLNNCLQLEFTNKAWHMAYHDGGSSIKRILELRRSKSRHAFSPSGRALVYYAATS